MKKEDNLLVRINNFLAGPFWIVSLLYNIVYIFFIIFTTLSNDISGILDYYLMGFPVFIVTVHGFFTGFILRANR